MRIKRRLVFSYLAMLIVPVLLTVIISLLTSVYYFGEIQGQYKDVKTPFDLRKSMQGKDIVLSEILKITLQHPEKLEEQSFLQQIEQKANVSNAGIIVRKNGEIIFSTKLLNFPIENIDLPSFATYAKDKVVIGKRKEERVLISQHDFYFPNEEEGSVFVVANMAPILRAWMKQVITIFGSLLLVLFLTQGILTYLVGKSILNPLKLLKIGIKKIEEGNLEEEIVVVGKDEIGELAIAVEQMRRELLKHQNLQKQYEKNRKELVAHISHDLKTPITAIRGYVEGIIDGVAQSPEKLAKYVRTIQKKSIEADQLINELFLFSKLDLSKMSFDFRSINYKVFIEDLVGELRFDLETEKRKVVLHIKTTEEIWVDIDAQKITRVIQNIIENSVKYNEGPKQEVELEIGVKQNKVYTTVTDNGPGIPKEILPFIFEQFYRGDKARNSEKGGSGLGLSIANLIVLEHKGEIYAQSEEGLSTSITFTLPIKRRGSDE